MASERQDRFGKQPIRSGRISAEQEREIYAVKPACEKCRHLTVRDNHCVCVKAHALDPSKCRDFSDCSRPRDYWPHFYHVDMRR